MELSLNNWTKPQNIIVILAHPDDPEFFCGATIARWVKEGHQVSYCLLTHGEKGSDNLELSENDISEIRESEQKKAANVLGVQRVEFLNYPDGYLNNDIEIRRSVVKVIRQHKPDIVVTSDPTNYFPKESYINHADHRIAGQIVIDAIFPAAGNPRFFPELLAEGYHPHTIREVWLSLTASPNIAYDVSDFWQKKIFALFEHKSQIGDREKFYLKMMSRNTPESSVSKPRFEETFKRFVFE